MADVLDEDRAACPRQCGELQAPYQIIETDEVDGDGDGDGDGEPIVKSVVDCPNCGRIETVLP
jgi:ribosomal protein S27AE